METIKGLLKSKTFWFNFGTGLFALIQQSVTEAGVDPVYLSSVVAIGNVVLRTVTSKALQDK